MDEDIRNAWSALVKYVPVLALLLLAAWAGYRGKWYWGRGVNAVIKQVEQDRDSWKELALELLRKQGIDPPRNPDPKSITDLINGKKG